MSQTLKLWNRFKNKPAGKWTFSKLLCLKAPYFSSISPVFERLETNCAEINIKKHRAVLNHIGTVHAIAMCNMAELAGGTMTDVTVPSTHRWIPKGMTVEYLKKAETDLIAMPRLLSAIFSGIKVVIIWSMWRSKTRKIIWCLKP